MKRIKPGSVAEKSGHIHVGDQLCKLGDVSLVGSRHYAVAAKLREVPVCSFDSQECFNEIKLFLN